MSRGASTQRALCDERNGTINSVGVGNVIAKWIVCCVDDSQRAEFSRAQERWSALEKVAGFHVQVGGWNTTRPDEACIVALWNDEASYQRFMRGLHDTIFNESRQSKTYRAITTALFSHAFDMPGTAMSVADALASATHLRVADCLVSETREEEFIEVQANVWRPAMATAGILGGVFGRALGNPRRFLVATGWPSAEAHEQYAAQQVTRLRKLAKVERDIEALSGFFVELDPRWSVVNGP